MDFQSAQNILGKQKLNGETAKMTTFAFRHVSYFLYVARPQNKITKIRGHVSNFLNYSNTQRQTYTKKNNRT